MYLFLNEHKHIRGAASPFSTSGNVLESRKKVIQGSPNLRFLLSKRLDWIPELRDQSLKGVELGAGAGITKLLIPESNILSTDLLDSEWLDTCGIDAHNTGFQDSEFDYVFINNVLHHLSYPVRFFQEAHRILRPGGKLFIQEIHTSLLMRFILKITNHESFSSVSNALAHEKPESDPKNPWDANCDLARQLFDDVRVFHRAVPGWSVVRDKKTECLTFLNSGGVIVSAPHIKLSARASGILWIIDSIATRLLPNLFALQRQIVLVKT